MVAQVILLSLVALLYFFEYLFPTMPTQFTSSKFCLHSVVFRVFSVKLCIIITRSFTEKAQSYTEIF